MPRQQANNPAVIVGIVIAGAFLFLFLAGMAALLVFGGRGKATTGSVATKTKTMTRADLKAAVMGMTQDEVKSLLGPPLRTSPAPSGGPAWMYEAITTDPANGRTDDYTLIYFAAGTGRVFKVDP